MPVAIACSKPFATTRARNSRRTGHWPTAQRGTAQHYFAMAKAAREGMQGPEQAEWIQRIEADIDNLRARCVAGA